MNGLAGARVVIVDDEEIEAIPIIKEFSKRDIPVAYFDGNVGALPTNNQRLLGVRLAILDMDLVGGGVSEKSKISALLGYLSKVLSSDNGPYGILIWTKHADLQQIFEEEVFKAPDIPNPVFTVCISKSDCKDTKGNFKINRISSEISKALKDFSPLLILQRWEEACFLSATQVTNELAKLAVQKATTLDDWRSAWKVEFLQLMQTLAMAEGGKQLNLDSCLGSLYQSMNPLHSDRMESNIPGLRSSLSAYSAEIMDSKPTADIKVKARLNTMLHLAFIDVNRFYAGNIYKRSKKRLWIPTENKLLDDFVDASPQNKKTVKTTLQPLCKSIVIEVNATCDHAQNNVRVARFIAGLLVPANEYKKIKGKVDFILKFGPVALSNSSEQESEYYMFFSARHLLTVELSEIRSAKAFARLRGQAFADLQAWFSHRSSRPGILMLAE